MKRAPKLININSAESAGKDKTRAVTKKRANKEGDKADSLDMFEFDDFLPEDGTNLSHVFVLGTCPNLLSQRIDEMELAASYLPDIDLNLVLSDFDWQASGDASALEARLITELQALEAVSVLDFAEGFVSLDEYVSPRQTYMISFNRNPEQMPWSKKFRRH